MNTKTHFCLEDRGETIKVEINGNGKDLISLLTNAIKANDDIRTIIEMALINTIANEFETQNEDDQLTEMLSKMKIGLA